MQNPENNNSPRFRYSSTFHNNELNPQFFSLNQKITLTSPKKTQKDKMGTSISKPNEKAVKADFGKLLKSSQFLTESRDTNSKMDSKKKRIFSSNSDTRNQVDSSFNFMVESIIQRAENDFEEKHIIKEKITIYKTKDLEKSDSLTAMKILNEKYNLGLKKLEDIEDLSEDKENSQSYELTEPRMRVNQVSRISNAKSDEVDLRSISRGKFQKDNKKVKSIVTKSNCKEKCDEKNLENGNPLKNEICFSNPRRGSYQSNNSNILSHSENYITPNLLDSFGVLNNFNNLKNGHKESDEDYDKNKEKDVKKDLNEGSKRVPFKNLEIQEKIDEKEDKSQQTDENDKENKNPNQMNLFLNPMKNPFSKVQKRRSYAISASIKSDNDYTPRTEPLTSQASLKGEFSNYNQENSPKRSINYQKTKKRKYMNYYASCNTNNNPKVLISPFISNSINTYNKYKYSEQNRQNNNNILNNINKKLKYFGDSMNNLYHGYGKIMDYQGEIIYEGEFKHGLYSGKGRIVNYLRKNKNADQDISTDFVRRYMSLSRPNYRGDLRGCRGIMDVNFEENGWEYYDGFFKDGKMHGNGLLVLSDGRSYEGGFEDGVAKGYGILDAFGKKVVGVWKNNVIERYL